ncbi:MAG: immunoglobulin domain-containing protein [Opitutae bacterium]|nr:immunoglobulin domain-containing protein [Opitutae bacterium]
MRNNFLRLLAALALAACGALSAFGYDLIYGQGGARVTWDAGSIPFVIRMSQTANLQDGTSYAGSVQAAMTTWNAQVTQVQFAPSIAASGLASDGDGVNEIAFDTKIYSNSTDPDNPPQDFGDNTLAVTLSWVATNARGDGTYQRTQSDILFNSKWTWDSYRGNLQQPEDIRRVAIHELGHVLGLDHPDQDGQSVTAIMNAYVSNIDSLQTDDLTGAQLLYSRPGGYSAPSNDNFASAWTISLSSGSTTVTGSSVGATKESGEPHHGHSNDGASIWWKWTAPSNGTLTINTLGTNFDTVLAAYTGDYVASLTQLAANDDASDSERRSAITFNVTAGTTYRFVVGGWDSQWGIVVLNLSFTPGQTDSAPTLTAQPSNQSITVGQTTQFSVSANGSPAPTFRWQRAASGSGEWSDISNGGNFSGADTATLSVVAQALSMSGDRFRCVVSNVAGSVTSVEATLTVLPAPPQITTKPLSRALAVGQSATFNVAATGSGTLNYQWRRNGQNIAGATAPSFTLNATATDGGYYEAVVTNDGGSTRSVFYVTVAPANATAATWGYSMYQDLMPPAGAAGFLQVAAGVVHSLGLKADGTVVSWGDLTHAEAVVPPGLTNVVRIAARSNASAALRSDGTVVVWGITYYHQTEVPAGLINVVDVAVGGQHCLALKAGGTVVAWGSNSRGQTDVPVGLQNVVAIAAGEEHSIALLADRTVVVWGGSSAASQTPPFGLANVKAIAAGGDHNLALKTDGTVVAWGFDFNGQATVPAGLNGVVAIAAGQSHSLALKSDGTIVAFGHNFYGQRDVPSDVTMAYGLGAGNYSSVALVPPVAPSFSTQPANATVNEGATMTFSVSVKGRPTPAIQWRKNGVPLVDGGRISGVTSLTLRITGVTPDDAGNYDAVATSSAGTATSAAAIGAVIARPQILQPLRTIQVSSGDALVVDATATVSGTYSWRHNDSFLSFTGSVLQIASASPADSGYYAVTVSNSAGSTTRIFHVRVTRPNRVVTWGANESGQTDLPAGLENVSDLVAGNGHAAALRADGTVVAWGRNDFGQRNVPAGLSGVVQLAAGGDHMLALKSDGSVVAWGRNSAGQATVPAGLTNVVQVAAGGNHSVALKNDGTVVAWGANESGQCLVPNNLRTTYAITAGERHTFVLTDLGFLAWGSSSSGELNVTSWSSSVFAAGDGFSIWALSGTGQLLGNGGVITPLGVDNVVAMSARASHYILLKSTGEVLARARSSSEQSGVPATLGNVRLVAAGEAFFAAAVAIDPPIILQQPQDLAVAKGASISLSVQASAATGYQWFKDDQPLADGGRVSGSSTATLTISGAQSSDQGSYRVRVTNEFGQVFSRSATCSVQAFLVTISPATANTDGSLVTLSVTASGTGPFTYQWFAGASGDTSLPVSGGTSNTLTVAQDDSLARYWVRVVSGADIALSDTMAVGRWGLIEPYFDTAYLYATASGGGVHVMVGDGAAAYSSNGVDWRKGTIESSASLRCVLHDGTRFVAGGVGGQLFSSADGRTWTKIRLADAGSSEVLSSVARGNGVTVFVGVSGKVLTLTSGNDWAWRYVMEQNANIVLRSVTFGTGRFVAAGYTAADGTKRVYQSTDGVNWARCSVSFSSSTYAFGSLNQVVFVSGRFVAMGVSEYYGGPKYAVASADGITWTAPIFSEGGGAAFQVGDHLIDSSFRTSTDGLTWSAVPTGVMPNMVNAIGYADGTYFALAGSSGSGASFRLWTSADLSNWSQRLGFSIPSEVAYGAGRFVAVSGNAARYSDDGVNWKYAVNPSAYSLGAVAYGNGLFVAVNSYTYSGYTHYTSTDGVTWTARNFIGQGQTAGFSGVAYLGGQWLMWNGGAIYRSSDGINWSGTISNGSVVASIAYGNGLYVGVGPWGTVATSSDGAVWSELTTRPTSQHFRKVVFGAGVFVAYAGDGTLWRSADGAEWGQFGTYPSGITALAFAGGQFLAAHGGDLLTSLDGRTWQVAPGALVNAGGSYRVVSNFLHAGGTWWASTNVERWLRAPMPLSAPMIDASPSNRSVASGQTATLMVSATGANLSFQWYLGEAGDTSHPIIGAISATFTTGALTQTTRFWVRISNADGFVNSSTVTVTIGAAPQITTQPQSADVVEGATANLGVIASGTPPLTYQWYRGNRGDTSRPISSATGGGYLTPSNATVAQKYWVRVSNGSGSVDSETVTVTPWLKAEQVVRLENFGSGFLRALTSTGTLTSSDGLSWQRFPGQPAATALAFGNGMYVGATNSSSSSTIYSSANGVDWAQRFDSGGAQTSGGVFGAGRFVLVGPGRTGSVLSSSDGQSWSVSSLGSGGSNVSLEAVCFDQGLFVGVGGDASGEAAIMTSPDGVNWTRRSLTISGSDAYRWLGGVTRAGSLFFAVGHDGGLMATSSDGVTWTQRQPPTFFSSPSIAWVNGIYCITDGSFSYYTSSDGLSWTWRPGPAQTQMSLVHAFNGRFWAVVGGIVFSSTDALTWEPRFGAPAIGYSVVSMTQGGGRFVTSGSWRNDYFSDDGIVWTQSQTGIGDQVGGRLLYALGKFFCTDADFGGRYWHSSDGSNWQVADIAGFSGTITRFEFANGMLVALGTKGNFATSTDGLSWTNRSIGFDGYLTAFAFGNGRYVVASDWKLWTSTNLVNWSASTQSDALVNRMHFGRGVFVGVGYERILTSVDGLNWTERQPAGFDAVEATFEFDGERFWILGGNALYDSTDGISWHRRPLPFGSSRFFAISDHTILVAADDGIWRSTDLGGNISITTQPVNRNVAAGTGTSFSVATSSPGVSFQWQYSAAGFSEWTAVVPGTNFSGVNAATLTLAKASLPQDGTRFRCVLSNGSTEAISAEATLNVYVAPPVIEPMPVSRTVLSGGAIELSVQVESPVAVTYQWFFNGSAISGATAATLTIPAFRAANNGNYWVRVTNSAGSATSSVTAVEIATAPVIDTQPAGGAFIAGTSPSLSVDYTTNTPPTFAWSRNNVGLTSSDSAIYTLSNIQPAHAGVYRVALTNIAGSVTSDPATVAVVPQNGVLFVAAGYSHSLFLRTDGRLFGMGRAVDGALPPGAGVDRVWTVPVLLAEDVVQMSAGDYFTVYITRDGKLWGRGSNNSGQLGDGTTIDRTEPILIASNVAAVDAGGEHTLFIKKDGTVWATGRNDSGQLGDGTTTNRSSPVQVADNAIAVSAGAQHSLLIKSGGTLWAAGFGGNGALGSGNTQNATTWQQVTTDVTAISAGGGHSLFIKTDGTLWATGYNAFFALGDGTSVDRLTPIQVATSVSLICAGYGNSLFTKTDGTLWAMGSNAGTFGNGTTASSSVPVQISVPSSVYAIAVGSGQALQARADGSLWSAGRNNWGQLGVGHRDSVANLALVTSGTLSSTSAPTDPVASDGTYSDGVRLTWTAPLAWRRFEVWRNTVDNSATATQLAQRVLLPYYFDATAVQGQTYYYWVKAANPAGATGFSASDTGYSSNGTPPVIVTPPASQTVTAGSDVTFTVSATGTPPFSYQWFKGTTPIAGATADTFTLPYVLGADTGEYSVTVTTAAGSTASAPATLAISGPAAVVQVATGAYHSLFLRGDGTLWAAGNNTAGQLGDGTTTNRENPVQVATDVRAIYAGWWHSFFLKSDGSLWAMGSNSYGQLGDGTTNSTTQPVQVMTDVVKVATWERRTLFLKSDGTLWVAGNGAMGGANVFASNPQPKQLMTDVRDMALGEQHMLVVKINGDLFAAGRNLFGQLGDGTTTNRASFVPVAAGVAAVVAGQEHSAFLKLDGTLWTVGLNDYGQLGTGDKTDRTQAVQIATGVRAVFAGYRRTWFVKNDGTLWRAGSTDAIFSVAGDATPVQVTGNPVAMASLLSHSLYLLADGRVLSAGENAVGQLADGTFTAHETASPVMPGVFAVPGEVSTLSATDAALTGAVRVIWSPVLGATGYEVWRGSTNNSAQATRIAAWVGETFYYDYTAPAATSYYWVRALSAAGVGAFGASDSGSPDLSALPQITAQPQDVKSYVGLSATLSVTATGAGPLSYQWMKDGATLDGATQAQLTLTNLQVANSGVYRVVVSNASGSVTSQAATLSVTVPHGVLHVSAGREHSLFLRTDGSLWGAGSSAFGQIPAGQNVVEVTSPTLIANDVVAMAAGWWHTLFVTADGRLYATGRNDSGQLGDGTTTNRSTPVLIASDVAAVGAGAENSYFIRKDGSLWGMGGGSWNQLGNGSLIRQLSPIKLLDRAVAVAVGERHAVVLKDDGTVWTAGYFSYGALGTGNSNSDRWAQIATGATAVAAGDNHTLFLKSDGSLWAAGDNRVGQLGNGTTSGTGGAAGVLTPFQVTTGVSMIAAGGNTSLVTKTDGTVWAMGANAGAYGNGTTTDELNPMQIFSGNAYGLSTSGLHTLIAVSDGSLRVTGLNYRGQLGNGTQTASTSFLSVATGAIVAPTAPAGLAAVAEAGGTGIRVTWNASLGWRRFEIWRGTTTSLADATMIVQRVSLPTYLDTTAQAGTPYYYWVKAANPAGVSAPSAMATSAGAPPAISQSPSNQTVDVGASVTFTVVADGTAPLTYQWRKGGNAIDGATAAGYTIASAQIADAGSYDVVVSNAFGSATSSAAALTVTPLSQTITFAALPDVAFSPTPITLTASASSSLPVSFTIVSGSATLSGNSLTLTAAGSLTVRAAQSGDATYAAAANVDRTFTVTKAPATVTLGALSVTYDGTAKSATATTNPDSLSVTLTYDGGPTAPTDAGNYAVAATIDDTRYQGTASDSLTIAKAAQTISFAALADQAFSATPLALSATSSSNLSVSFAVVSGPATLNGSALTLTGAGTVTIRAAQSGNANYLAAPNVDRSFVVAMGFDAWLREHFTSDELLDATISGPNADSDGDGFVNLTEYALGADPRADSAANAPQMSATATDWTFTYTRPADRSDIVYTVEYSTNLTTWSSVGVTHTLVSSSNGAETWRATYPVSSAPACFLRLVVAR